MNDLYCTNLANSGLGDRITDMMILYTYGKIKKYNKIYFKWEYSPAYEFLNNIDNILYHIEFPKDFIIINNLDNLDNIDIFEEKLGVISIYLFIDKYMINDSEDLKNIFIEKYFELFIKINFKNIPINIIDTFNSKDIITIHLRRTDKISLNPYVHGTIDDELNILNNKTKDFINYCILKNDNKICFISDDDNIKQNYINEFKNKCNVIFFNINNYSQVFIDLYCLSNSKKIFMSQKFSTFSILGSLIRGTELYYPFNYGRLYDFDNIIFNYYKYKNFIYFNNIIK